MSTFLSTRTSNIVFISLFFNTLLTFTFAIIYLNISLKHRIIFQIFKIILILEIGKFIFNNVYYNNKITVICKS